MAEVAEVAEAAEVADGEPCDVCRGDDVSLGETGDISEQPGFLALLFPAAQRD